MIWVRDATALFVYISIYTAHGFVTHCVEQQTKDAQREEDTYYTTTRHTHDTCEEYAQT